MHVPKESNKRSHTARPRLQGNQAVAAAQLGARTSMVGRVGNDDFGKRLLSHLSDAGVDAKHGVGRNYFLKVPPGPPFPEELHRKTICGIVWAYCGPLDKVEEAFRPVRKFRAPKFELTGPMPYTALQSMFDAIYPPGDQWYWRGDFVARISDEAIGEHLKFAEQLPTLKSTMHLYPVDGAASRIDRHETAFSYRERETEKELRARGVVISDSVQIYDEVHLVGSFMDSEGNKLWFCSYVRS